ncbi:hypothetical protein JR334_02160 [Clostridia bacterium]|nr:hypothetical protein JR334_02160 [Clostridia bacterium]
MKRKELSNRKEKLMDLFTVHILEQASIKNRMNLQVHFMQKSRRNKGYGGNG